MYTFNDLKEKITISDSSIECPVKGCENFVDRKRKINFPEKNFSCKAHNIEITPSTFIYESMDDNILWKDNVSKDLFQDILKFKRECRISSENSEDAVTWNVIRYLEINKLLGTLLSTVLNEKKSVVEVIYWSYSPVDGKDWSLLRQARIEFGEPADKGSEPDIIVITDTSLIFIEAKFFSSNKTSPTGKDSKKYLTGGDNLFEHIFKRDYHSIILDQKYELMRFWLLGNHIARNLTLSFHLINLVLEGRELEIRNEFGKHVLSDDNFHRLTWESIYRFILGNSDRNEDTNQIISYFQNKAGGYDSHGRLRKAFSI